MIARPLLKRVLAACLLTGAAACASAQSGSDATVSPSTAARQAREIAQGDPARWYREDATVAQRMRTRQKELGAALAEAKTACRQGPAGARQSCLKAAQATWRQEMASPGPQAPAQPGS